LGFGGAAEGIGGNDKEKALYGFRLEPSGQAPHETFVDGLQVWPDVLYQRNEPFR
jgi:hypothetical protein